eukprot:6176224-Pleurochrysis_carterae.AAC.2
MKSTAARQADGSYVLNGAKMWITNGAVRRTRARVLKTCHISCLSACSFFLAVSSSSPSRSRSVHPVSSSLPALALPSLSLPRSSRPPSLVYRG